MKIYSPYNSTDNIGILHNNKNIRVSCDSIATVTSYYHCKNSLDYSNQTNYFCSNREDPNAWITYFFPEHSITITNYSLKTPKITGSCENCGCGPNNFKVVGKIGDNSYPLDEVEESGLCEPETILTRQINRIDSYDSITITMTSKTNFDEYEFRIGDFDIFGIFSPQCKTIKKSSFFKLDIAFILIII